MIDKKHVTSQALKKNVLCLAKVLIFFELAVKQFSNQETPFGVELQQKKLLDVCFFRENCFKPSFET